MTAKVKTRKVVYLGAEVDMEAGRAELFVQTGRAQYPEVIESLAAEKKKAEEKAKKKEKAVKAKDAAEKKKTAEAKAEAEKMKTAEAQRRLENAEADPKE